MAITVSQIDAWRAARSEHQNLEFKEAKAQFEKGSEKGSVLDIDT